MLLLGVLLLVSPAIFAADLGYNGNYRYSNPSAMPMDYNDDIKINPNSNFVFNFEQIRRDQPPQVEMREEKVGQYMYRPTTTPEPFTTPSAHRIPESKVIENKQDPFSKLSNMLPPVTNRYDHQWNSNPMPSTTMSVPPPPPQWNDFADAFNNHAQSYFSPDQDLTQNLPASRNFYNHNHHAHAQQPNPQHQNKVPAVPGFRRNNLQPSLLQRPSPMPEYIAPSTTTTSMRPEMRFGQDLSAPKPFDRRGQQPSSNRGSHKFSWDDVTTARPSFNPISQQTSTVANVNQSRGPPPPVPTLSPWIDGYGK